MVGRVSIPAMLRESPNPAPVATDRPATGQGSTRPAKAKAAPSGDGQHRADGVTLLTTSQAWQHCLELGWVSPEGSTTKDAWRGWASRYAADLRTRYGLEATGYSGKPNNIASYRKVP